MEILPGSPLFPGLHDSFSNPRSFQVTPSRYNVSRSEVEREQTAMAKDRKSGDLAAASGLSTRDLARVTGLSVDQVRAYVRAGLLTPRRGTRRQYLFSFRDLLILRAARALQSGCISAGRVRAALRQLRRQLPAGVPLTEVQMRAEGGQVLARQGARLWNPESGQILFDFQAQHDGRQSTPPRMRRNVVQDAETWFEIGVDLEDRAPGEAARAYRKALLLDPRHADSHLNLGRLLHEKGKLRQALRHYREARRCDPTSATAAYNLGVVLEDLGRLREAARAYRHCLRLDPALQDAYYNLAGVCERLGEPAEALRCLKSYKQLAESFR